MSVIGMTHYTPGANAHSRDCRDRRVSCGLRDACAEKTTARSSETFVRRETSRSRPDAAVTRSGARPRQDLARHPAERRLGRRARSRAVHDQALAGVADMQDLALEFQQPGPRMV